MMLRGHPGTWVLAAVLSVCVTQVSAREKKFDLLYSFCTQSSCADGLYPHTSLLNDGKGDLFGTTFEGGKGAGTVFEITPSGTESVFYDIPAGDGGSEPEGGLIADSQGNFYGTTYEGGVGYAGTVFQLSPQGVETVLYAFHDGSDGGYPTGKLVRDSAGNLYGVAVGSSTIYGEVFEVESGGTINVVYEFSSSDQVGYEPNGGLVIDAQGNLYGTTSSGNAGAVFELSPGQSGWTATAIYSFCVKPLCSDGSTPEADLIQDGQGNFYGTTSAGGLHTGGTVFELSPTKGGGWSETVLYNFCAKPGCPDGLAPSAGVVRDNQGNLYGTTAYGGANDDGTIFRLSKNGRESVLHSFSGSDGINPANDLIIDKGQVYGTTLEGGAKNDGVVFRVGR